MAPMPAESTRSFISYAREDAEFALKLAADLRQAGVNVWVDRFDIPVGKNWPRAVEEALDSCGQFLVIRHAAANRGGVGVCGQRRHHREPLRRSRSNCLAQRQQRTQDARGGREATERMG